MKQLPSKIKEQDFDENDDYRLAVKINQLIDYLKDREEVTNKLVAQINNLRGGWTDIEIKKVAFKPAFPQKGDLIYRMNSGGQIIEQRWTASEKQIKCQSFLGVYPTQKAAEAARAKLLEIKRKHEQTHTS